MRERSKLYTDTLLSLSFFLSLSLSLSLSQLTRWMRKSLLDACSHWYTREGKEDAGSILTVEDEFCLWFQSRLHLQIHFKGAERMRQVECRRWYMLTQGCKRMGGGDEEEDSSGFTE